MRIRVEDKNGWTIDGFAVRDISFKKLGFRDSIFTIDVYKVGTNIKRTVCIDEKIVWKMVELLQYYNPDSYHWVRKRRVTKV